MDSYLRAIKQSNYIRNTGRVSQFYGLALESFGPDVFLGELCHIHSRNHANPVPAEVVGIKDGKVMLMPYGEMRGIRLGSEVHSSGRAAQVGVGYGLLGRVIDAFGKPIDGKGDVDTSEYYPLYNDGLNPLTRPRITNVLETGIRCIDSLLTIGRGQRVGIFAGSGVGKSSLMGMIARDMNADVNVIALVGERGREVRDFVDDILGPAGLKRSVVVVATSDQPALVRTHAALTATSIAEYFRDQGKHVLLTMDSVTRFAMAQREIGLAVGEPPTSRGYTPSVFAVLPKLLERTGTADSGGSITALYTVLVEGDDINDPIADSVRSILDGHIVLSRDLANHRHFPAIDILLSNSRLITQLLTQRQLSLSNELVKTLSIYEKSRDLVEIGAHKPGANPELDRAIRMLPAINTFLKQSFDVNISMRQAFIELSNLVSSNK